MEGKYWSKNSYKQLKMNITWIYFSTGITIILILIFLLFKGKKSVTKIEHGVIWAPEKTIEQGLISHEVDYTEEVNVEYSSPPEKQRSSVIQIIKVENYSNSINPNRLI